MSDATHNEDLYTVTERQARERVARERAAIVAWLRMEAEKAESAGGRAYCWLEDCADAIERGEHRGRP